VVGWSPYNGREIPWRVAGTYRRGELVFDGTSVLAQPGSGRFVRPPPMRPIAP
jgi:allantoinase